LNGVYRWQGMPLGCCRTGETGFMTTASSCG